MKKVLHISNKPPYPKLDGGCVAIANILEMLSTCCEVSHWTISTQKHPFQLSEYPKETNYRIITPSLQLNTRLNPFKLLRYFLKGQSVHLQRFYSKKNQRKLINHLKEHSYDYIVLDSVYSALHIKDIKAFSKAQLIIRTHNVEFDIWNTKNRTSKGFKLKILQKLINDLKREEIRLLKEADRIWTITETDLIVFKTEVSTPSLLYVPLAIKLQQEPIDEIKSSFFHLGSLNWGPNKDAVIELITEIWPRYEQIKQRNESEIKLNIAGSFGEKSEWEKYIKTSTIEFHGFVENLTEFYVNAGILLAPIRSGSGVRIKILEAMSYGIPCITTKIGAQGIDRAQSGLICAETIEEWMDRMNEMIQHPEQRKELGKAGFEYIRNYHNWEKVCTMLQNELEDGRN